MRRRVWGGEDLASLIARIRDDLKLPVFADISTVEEGIVAESLGATYVATTLAGYTDETASPREAGPDFGLIEALARRCTAPIIAEGRFDDGELAAEALARGAWGRRCRRHDDHQSARDHEALRRRARPGILSMAARVGLGIDAGGSATRWVLRRDGDEQPLASGEAGPASGHLFDPAVRERSLALFARLITDVSKVARPDCIAAGVTGSVPVLRRP